MLNWPLIPRFTKRETDDHVSYHLFHDWSPYQNTGKTTSNHPYFALSSCFFPSWLRYTLNTDMKPPSSNYIGHKTIVTTMSTTHQNNMCRHRWSFSPLWLFPPPDLPYGHLPCLIPTCLCGVRTVFTCIVYELTMKQSECILNYTSLPPLVCSSNEIGRHVCSMWKHIVPYLGFDN
jgi:hypothetical protein